MAFNLQAERERRNALAKDTRNLLDQNPGATWNDEHQAKYDENTAEIERIDAAISRHQTVLDLTAERDLSDMGGRERDPSATPNAVKLFDKWCRGGDNAITADEWTAIRNTMSTTTDSEGGYTVPETVAGTILDAMKSYGGMRSVADIIRTASGEQMNFPTSDGTSEVGEIIGQNASATDADVSFGTKPLVVYKYSSKVVTVPWELLQDSSSDIEGFVRARLQTRLGRITNTHFTTGTGTNQPTGLITAATVGKTGAVSATPAITYDDLIDLEHSVDPAYRSNASWMFHDSMLQLIRKVKDTEGRPIFVPGYEQGNPGGAPDRLLNRNITINQDMAAPLAAAVSVAFGDFSYYKIRDVMAITMFRFTDSAYTKKGQVGFMAWMRSGGNLVDVGGAVKTFKHGAAA
ncbi:phage major capsid protein (plasmid) [Pusillimonas sp. T7-7]|uniref:phage major capsid protein n=1 Tax=Pusillimonas sp. (strain T7-7) TaxID=1007105 RepID=UPI0002084BC5|nr:phage major capsid protein [Pusillimonas sp. T7-7]AEC22292.1 phage major capsid protein [Pusillimonas sp. T7-7]